MSDKKNLPRETRQARAFIYSRGLTSQNIQPRLFSLTAKKLGKSFTELLRIISMLKSAGQGRGESPKAEEFIR